MIPHGYLVHHGILGQKWGIRRYQNADGSLTEEGRKKYYNSNGQLTKEGAKSEYWKNKRNKMNNRAIDLEERYDKENKATLKKLMMLQTKLLKMILMRVGKHIIKHLTLMKRIKLFM